MTYLKYNGQMVQIGEKYSVHTSPPPPEETVILLARAYQNGSELLRSEDSGVNFTVDVSTENGSFTLFTSFAKDGSNILIGDSLGNIYDYSEGSISSPTSITSTNISDIQVRGSVKVAGDRDGNIITIT